MSKCIKGALVPVLLTVDITAIDLPVQTNQWNGFCPICLCFRWDAKAGAWDASVESGRSLCWSSDPGNRRTCPGHGWRSSPSALPGRPPRKVSVCVCDISKHLCVCVCVFVSVTCVLSSLWHSHQNVKPCDLSGSFLQSHLVHRC